MPTLLTFKYYLYGGGGECIGGGGDEYLYGSVGGGGDL